MSSTFRVKKHRFLKKLSQNAQISTIVSSPSMEDEPRMVPQGAEKARNGKEQSAPCTSRSLSRTNCDQCGILAIQIEEMKKKFQIKLDKIEIMLQRLIEEKVEDCSSFNKIELELPLQTVEQVFQLDAQIAESDNFKRQLVTVLLIVGGHDLHKSTYNVLKKLLHPELTLQFSAFGKGQKLSFVNLKLYGVVKEVLLQRFCNSTEDDVRKSVIRFFVSAKDRIKINKQ